MSFYSKALYRDVGMNWKKVSYLYLLLLLGVCLIPSMFKTHSMVSDYVLQKAPGIVKQIPPITITSGQVSVNVQMPHVIQDPENSTPLIIIDTTGQTTTLKDSRALILLTKTGLLMRRSETETRTLDLSAIDSLVVDQSLAYDWIETFLDYFIFVLFPFVLLFSYSLRIVQAMIFVAIGAALSRRLGASLKFSSLMSLAIVSMTPAIIFDAVQSYADATIPSWWLINFFIALGYLFFAVRAAAEKDASETEPH
ncbi:MAG TPA: DUF1189 family protein [Thermodesulfovibrionales bacterium]|nr:DUF1189 family protein [Thermodesulfovibrionales bacterium]